MVTGVIKFVVILLLAWLVVLLARGPLTRVEGRVVSDPWRAALAGLLAWVLFVPLLVLVIVVLAISIVGIPLLVLIPPALILAFLIALLLGYTGVAMAMGRWLERRFGWHFGSTFVAILGGMVAIEVWSIVSDVFDVFAGPVPLIAGVTMIFGLMVRFAAWTVGLGAVILTRFGAGPRRAADAVPAELAASEPTLPAASEEPTPAYEVTDPDPIEPGPADAPPAG